MGRNDEALALMERTNKELGEGAVMIASDMVIPKRFPTGSLGLDVSLGGGLAGNQWTEIYGPENHGKTTIALKILAHNQRIDLGFQVLWVAAEHYDLSLARMCGVDTDRVYVLSTRDMGLAYDKICEFLEQRAVDAVVLDSYPALIPPDEDEKAMYDNAQMSEGAKMTNKFFRKVGKAGLRNPQDPDDRPFFGIFINQPREKPGAWAPHGQVAETTPGGRGKNFSFYCRLDVKRAEWIEVGAKSSKVKVGQVIRTRAVKNKGAPPHRVASIDYYFANSGEFEAGAYDDAKDVLTMAVLFGVVNRGGAWYRYGEERWNGLPNALADLRGRPDLMGEIETKTREIAAKPEEKRTWDETEVESAAAAKTTVRRRKRREDDDQD